MGIQGAHRADFRQVLRNLHQDGVIVRLRKNRWALPDGRRQLTGRLRVSVQGFGFVTPETEGADDVFIPEAAMGTALDGDRVVVDVESGAGRRERGALPHPRAAAAAGRVVRVLDRARTSIVGLLRRTRYYWYVIPDSPRIPHNVRVRSFEKPVGEPVEFTKVVTRLDAWERPHLPLTGIVTESLGPAGSATADRLSILRDHGISDEFSPRAVHEAARHSAAVPAADLADGRRDLRDTVTFTIDPEDARDFDDAVSLEPMADGRCKLGVHIADVPHFVPQGSVVDEEAYLRGNSVYLVDSFVPMLPPYLTSEVCSLRAGTDRLTHSVTLVLDRRGHVLQTDTFPSIIRSRARLSYDQVQRMFDGHAEPGMPDEVAHVLAAMRSLARTLRAGRMAAGSIDLHIPEIRFRLDPDGKPVEVFRRMSDEAYHLIEEFMLMANCAVARILATHEVPAVYRVHEPPDEKQWSQMSSDLRALGVGASSETRDELNEIVRAAVGTPMEYAVHLGVLRNLKRALYSSTLAGHFGLAFARYTHFTSPIRRYPDLVVHRMLRAIETRRPPPYSFEEAAQIAKHCSDTERSADEAESDSVEVKRLEYYQERLRRGEVGPFRGLVVSMVPKGLIVELSDTFQRGLVPFSSMHDDYYVLSPDRYRATGRRHRRTWALGQALDVCLTRLDPARRLVDFTVPADAAAQRTPKRASGKRRHRRAG